MRRADRLAGRMWVAITAGFVLLVAAYAALLPLSHWQGDEFFYFAMLRDQGRWVLVDRVFGWSPRPFSELLFYLYGSAVIMLRQPLAGWFLGLLWIAWVASVLAGIRCCGKPAGGGSPLLPRVAVVAALPRGAVVAALLGAMLCVRPLSEVFFWPAGAVAYLSTLIGVCLCFWMCIDAGVSGWAGAWGLAAVLSLVAACSEVGAMFAVSFVGARIVVGIFRRRRGRAHLSRQAPMLLPLLLPGVVAGFVFWVVLHNRVAVGIVGGAGEPYLRRFWPSVGAGFRLALGELPMLDDGRDTSDAIGAGLVFKLMLFFGWRWISGATFSLSAHHGERVTRLSAFCIGLGIAAWGSAFAAYFQFGYSCCARHWIMREEFSILAIAALGVLSALWLAPGLVFSRSDGVVRVVTAVPFAVMLMLAVALRAGDLLHDYRLIPVFIQDRAGLWSALHDSGASMTCALPPRGWIVGDMEIPPGDAVIGANPPWYYEGIMDFFGKSRIDCAGP